MHQCDYCCWYNERYGNCDCPYVMKKLSCDKAKKEKERSEKAVNRGRIEALKHLDSIESYAKPFEVK